MNYIFFTHDQIGDAVALKLQKEGNKVIVGVVNDLKLTLTDQELKEKPDAEEPDEKKLRLSIYEGMVKKVDAVKLLKAMSKLENKDDYFVFSNSNATFRFLEKAQKMGFKNGLFATQEQRLMETDRTAAKDVVKENYPDLKVKEAIEFSKAQEGVAYLNDSEKSYVLKSLGDAGETVVGKSDDPKLNNQLIIDALEKDKSAYEMNGFMLEEKITNGIELTPEAVFYNGKLVYTVVDIETKTIGSGEKGHNVGCGTNLIIKTDPEDKINKIAFPPYIHDMAKKIGGMFIIDAGIIFDNKGDGYFLEYCANRLGWDSFPTELAMSGDNTSFFESLVKGKNPLKSRFGTAVRLFNDDKKQGLSVNVDKKADKDVYLYDVKQDKDKIVSVGYQKDIGVVTGASNNLKEAIDCCYEYVDMVGVKDVNYRFKDDFLSVSYAQAILNRLKYAVEQKLIKDEGILSTIQEIVDSRLANAQKELEAKMKTEYDSKLKEESGKMKADYDGKVKNIKKSIKEAVY